VKWTAGHSPRHLSAVLAATIRFCSAACRAVRRLSRASTIGLPTQLYLVASHASTPAAPERMTVRTCASRSPTICRNMRNTRRRAKTSADRDAASVRHGHATGPGRRSGLNRVPQEPSLLVPGYLGKWRSPRRKISPRRQWRVAAGSPGSCHRGSPNFLAPPPPAVPYPSANVATPKQEAT
jgi:hypothetical protein